MVVGVRAGGVGATPDAQLAAFTGASAGVGAHAGAGATQSGAAGAQRPSAPPLRGERLARWVTGSFSTQPRPSKRRYGRCFYSCTWRLPATSLPLAQGLVLQRGPQLAQDLYHTPSLAVAVVATQGTLPQRQPARGNRPPCRRPALLGRRWSRFHGCANPSKTHGAELQNAFPTKLCNSLTRTATASANTHTHTKRH